MASTENEAGGADAGVPRLREAEEHARKPFVAIVSFAEDFFEFRIPELEAVAAMLGVDVEMDRSVDVRETPFVRVVFPTLAQAIAVATRCVGIKAVFEYWADAPSMDELYDAFCARASDVLAGTAGPGAPSPLWLGPDVSLCFRMSVHGAKRKSSAQLAIFQKFLASGLLTGRIQLKKPDVAFWICENYARHPGRTGGSVVTDVWIGRKVCNGARDLVSTYDLKKRAYLGTTSMHAELGFLMANQAHARPASLVFDPFVGTGSLLLPAAVFGATVVGSDLCGRTMRGEVGRYDDRETVQRDIWANVIQFSLGSQWLDVFTQDMANAAFRTNRPLFDAIVADPPYGIREGAKKIGPKSANAKLPNQDQFSTKHIPQRVPYNARDILGDMLTLAARSLVLGGRLVYWLATTTEYDPSHVPTHPALVVVANSEQFCTFHFRRRLITMVKVAEWDDAMVPSVPDIHDDDVAGTIRSKLTNTSRELTQAERKAERKRRREMGISRGLKKPKHNPAVVNQIELQRALDPASDVSPMDLVPTLDAPPDTPAPSAP